MKAALLFPLLFPLVAAALAGQAPTVRPGASLDVAALALGEVRASVAPIGRLTPWNNLFVDVGGKTRLITFADPTARFTEGHLDSRLTLAVGVDW